MSIEALNTSDKSTEGAWMDVIGVDGEPFLQDNKPVRIKLLGPTSDVIKDARRRSQTRIIKAAQQRRNVGESEIEAQEKSDFETAVAATVEWENVVLGGDALKCTKANVRNVYKVADFLYDQVQEFINDWRNFMKGSSQS